MFNLISGVIAIVVMIAVGVAGLSYLGPAFHTAAAKAEVAQFVNGSTQILGAATLYRTETGGGIADVSDGSAVGTLTMASYLSHAPAPPKAAVHGAAWKLTTIKGKSVVSIELDDDAPGTAAICALAEEQGASCTDDLSTIAP